jgi:Leucine-rich repeat (LRR) protein
LEAYGLAGRLPSNLADLANITYIQLYENSLTGPIPSSLGALISLVELDLNTNSLTGSILLEVLLVNILVSMLIG